MRSYAKHQRGEGPTGGVHCGGHSATSDGWGRSPTSAVWWPQARLMSSAGSDREASAPVGIREDESQPAPLQGEAPTQNAEGSTRRLTRSATATDLASAATLVRDGLKPNLSAVEATSQLKVLCRKFAALTEKVKEETKVREDAEREVRRLRAIVEGKNAPVVASCRAETQAYIKELKDAQELLRRELRTEKEKNAKLVSKALELEKEKSALLAAATARSESTDGRLQLYAPSALGRTTSEWGREQSAKIHETLRVTIDELQDELTRKQDEIASYRDRLQRERGRVKALEIELQEKGEAARDEQNVLRNLQASIHEQREQFEAIEKEMQQSEERLQEEAAMRATLEQQIETLNDVNEALEQRAKALVRRLELNQSITAEMEELKMQVRDAEVDKETLVRSIKEVKDQHYLRETQWKAQMEQLRSEKLVLSTQIQDLQSEISSLRNQNSMLSEWMLVRSENLAAAQQQHQQHKQQLTAQTGAEDLAQDLNPGLNQRSLRVRPLAPSQHVHDESNSYVHTTKRCPLSPSKTRSMTTASPIKQQCSWHRPLRRTSVTSSASSSGEDAEVRWESHQRDKRTTTRRGVSSAKLTTKPSSGNVSDHERLRELMSRNRELQNRLQRETLATRNLEQEISHITQRQVDAVRLGE